MRVVVEIGRQAVEVIHNEFNEEPDERELQLWFGAIGSDARHGVSFSRVNALLLASALRTVAASMPR